MIVPHYQRKSLKIIIVINDIDDPTINEGIIYPNILVINNDYTFFANDYLIADEMYFAITGSE